MSAPSRARPPSARRWAVAGVLALTAYGVTVVLLLHGLGSSGMVAHHLDVIGAVLAGCASLPIIWWRFSPIGVFILTTIGSAALMARGYPGGPPVGTTIALYLVAASRDPSQMWTRRVVAIVIVMFCLHIAAYGAGHGTLPEIQLAVGALVWALAWFAGERTRLRRHEVAELEQRAIRAERDATRERRLAVAEERARIARELHDSAAHAINVIAVQAGAARLWQSADPSRARAALETIEDVAQRTVAEIDQIVHSLRFLIADDDHLMRAGLAAVLESDADIEVVGQASTGREAIALTCRREPDVVLMDVQMPDLDGIEATRELTRAAARARVLILTTFEEDEYIFGGLHAGASGFLLKRTRPEDLIRAVHTIAAGESLLSPSVTRRVIDRMAHQPDPPTGSDPGPVQELTPREGEVLALMAGGLSNAEIACELVIEESTVKTHVKRVLMKLGLRDRVQAVIFAYEHGLAPGALNSRR